MGKTKIEWATHSWSPITGCSKISEGCRNCWAERMARRLAGRYGYPEAPHHFDVTVHDDKMDQPLRWKKPRRIFVCSMGDLFHEDVPTWVIDIVFLNMRTSPQHTFLILTKRPRWMHYLLSGPLLMSGKTCAELYPNVWLGVTAENQQRADERIPVLLQIPAVGHFVSLEPMLGAVDLTPYLYETCRFCGGLLEHGEWYHHINKHCSRPQWGETNKRPALDWAIVGGESGPGARPMEVEWARSIKDQCVEACVPFFLKQMQIDGKMVKMPGLDGREWNEYPKTGEKGER